MSTNYTEHTFRYVRWRYSRNKHTGLTTEELQLDPDISLNYLKKWRININIRETSASNIQCNNMICTIFSWKVECDMRSIIPVSYTHLDVYKRQTVFHTHTHKPRLLMLLKEQEFRMLERHFRQENGNWVRYTIQNWLGNLDIRYSSVTWLTPYLRY